MISEYTIINGDSRAVLQVLPSASVRCCVTSPPYLGLRDYGMPGQIGLEPSPSEYVAQLVHVFEEVRRILTDDGTLWLNLGDSYARAPEKGGSGPGGKNLAYSESYGRAQQVRSGSSDGFVHRAPGPRVRTIGPGLKPKDLIGMPWRVAFALQEAGWWLRSDVIWFKPNAMPESVADRPTRAHEYLFLFAKSERYFYDAPAISEPVAAETAARCEYGFQDQYQDAPDIGGYRGRYMGSETPEAPTRRNKRTVWTIPTKPLREAHFAPFPEDLVLPCVLAGSAPGDTVLDPFNGAGTTGVVAAKNGRHYVGIELNPEYVEISKRRIGEAAPLFARPAPLGARQNRTEID